MARWYCKWNTPNDVLVFVDTELDSGFYGQNDKTPFLCFTRSLEEDENRLQFEWNGKSMYATVDGENLLWDDGDTYTRHDFNSLLFGDPSPRSLALARSAFGLQWGGLRPRPHPPCEL